VRKRGHPGGDDEGSSRERASRPSKGHTSRDLLRPNLIEFARKGAADALRRGGGARQLLRWRRLMGGGVSLMDVVMGLADGPRRVFTRAPAREKLTCPEGVASPPNGRLRGRWNASCTSPHRPGHLQRAWCSPRRRGSRTCRSPTGGGAHYGSCRWSMRPFKVNDRELIDGALSRQTKPRTRVLGCGPSSLVVDQPDRPLRQRLQSTVRTLDTVMRPRGSRTWALPDRLPGCQLVAHPACTKRAKHWEERYQAWKSS